MRDEPPDFELLNAWSRGDLAAGNALFNRHFRSVFRFFRNKVHIGVEDLVQGTFLSCVEGCARFRREASFRTFLFQTARHRLYAHYRDVRRNPSLDFSAVTSADLSTSPSQAIARKQEHRLLLEALRRVPVEHQVVLELAFWEDMSGPDIAAVLEIPPATARTRLRRALLRLKFELTAAAGADLELQGTARELGEWANQIRVLWQMESSDGQASGSGARQYE